MTRKHNVTLLDKDTPPLSFFSDSGVFHGNDEEKGDDDVENPAKIGLDENEDEDKKEDEDKVEIGEV